jgi:hypothetical protein
MIYFITDASGQLLEQYSTYIEALLDAQADATKGLSIWVCNQSAEPEVCLYTQA